MLRVREAKDTPAEYLTIELLLSGGADLPAMAVADMLQRKDARKAGRRAVLSITG